MRDNSYQEDREEMRELLQQYENLKVGRNHSFLEEDAFERIIDYFDEKDELSKAMEAADIGIEQFPFSSVLMIKKADLLLAARKYNDALDILEKAELFDSNDINLFILKTDAYLALDQQLKAVQLLEEALLQFDGEERIELLFELADVYDDYEEFDKVFDCLKLILEEEPNNEEALYKICFWTDFTGRNEESIQLHHNIIDEFPYNELAWFNLGAAYQGLKLYEKAIDAYLYAVTIDEKFDYAYRNMGDAYLRMRKFKEAIEVLEKVLELSRPEDVIYEAIGHCYHKIGNFAQARFNYRKASHLNPEDSKLYYKMALTYINEEQWDSAIKQLESAMRIHRTLPEYNLAMGECRMQLNQFKEAIQYFGNVVRSRPKSVAGWEALIRCLYKAGFYDEAREQCIAALKATEGKTLFYFYMSAALFALKKHKEAMLQLEEALSQSPRQLKKFIALNPAILQNTSVVELVGRYKKTRK
ncbi:tetratricopeptide repeat protein [Segetibacter sp. 3557_3]|uniref:tetratricopeptide repeat protein n=1 Tax=Segetibacter sp. 3557_3 TaxID=2547429 RepID=UPI0010586DB7|nr:tetratricopeptide repeat protein [Segetibacter sp. 3557_3]TDH18294.1 tetratricopeptide repeat protein [Segetibacter sp. 3557_3]